MGRKVLVIATSINTRGGITSVIKGYQQTKLWTDWNCYWLPTHIDRNSFIKIAIFLSSFAKFWLLLPFYRIIHVHLSETSSALRKLPFIFIANVFNKNIIVHFHSFSITTSINSKHKKRYERIFHLSNKIIVLSEQWKNWLTDNWPQFAEKIIVLYNPCPTVLLNENQHFKNKSILFAGTLNERKGYADLIIAFAQIAKFNKDWNLIFAGNGELEKAKQIAIDFQVQDQVIFKGWVSGNQKDELFKSASIFCLPSYAEGFPMAVLDAWAYGLPVITTPVGGLPDVLINEKNSLVFHPGDISTLALHLDKLIVDESLRQTLSDASILLSKDQFCIDNITQKLSDLYSEILS